MSTVIIRKKKAVENVAPRKVYGLYMKSILDRKICLAITEIGKNVKVNLENKIHSMIAGKCVDEGFIKPQSIKIVNYSSGNVNSNNVEFNIVFECMVCLPTEGMDIECVCKTVTKAGIHAQVIDDDDNMPITMFIARDHHHLDNRFSDVKVGDKLVTQVIGIRYELNDDFICTIGKLSMSRN